MKAQFKAEKKKLVETIGKITARKPEYLGAPSFAYNIGAYRVNRDGTVECDSDTAMDALIFLLAEEKIFTEDATDGACIWIPKDTLTETAVENLKKVTQGKKELFKRAFNETNIEILDEEDKVGFPWFPIPDSESEMKAYTEFVEKLCKMALTQKKVSDKEKPIVNEKYEFRCFLLRLGMIGDEYKGTRKVLLKNLSGSAAFKNK